MAKLEKQPCPVCMEKKLTLVETSQEVPYFGKIYIMSMDCSGCGFKKSDIMCEEEKEPSKYTFEISKKNDLKVRVVKSSEATVKFPKLKITIEPGVNAEGFVSNVERLLNDILKVLEMQKEGEEEKAKKKKLRKMIDQILDIKEGKAATTLVIEDPAGNSAIISEKAKKERLKAKKKK